MFPAGRLRDLRLGAAAVHDLHLGGHPGAQSWAGSTDELEALPEAALVYPEAALVHVGGQHAEGTITGPISARYRLMYRTDDRPGDVFAWYADRLERPRWVESFAAYNTFDLVELQAWCSEEADVQLQIAFYDADDPRFEPGEFEVFLRATEPDYECRDVAP
jgi:hypothetical protein